MTVQRDHDGQSANEGDRVSASRGSPEAAQVTHEEDPELLAKDEQRLLEPYAHCEASSEWADAKEQKLQA